MPAVSAAAEASLLIRVPGRYLPASSSSPPRTTISAPTRSVSTANNSRRSSAAGATKSTSSACARSTTARKAASAPTCGCRSPRCCSPASPRPAPRETSGARHPQGWEARRPRCGRRRRSVSLATRSDTPVAARARHRTRVRRCGQARARPALPGSSMSSTHSQVGHASRESPFWLTGRDAARPGLSLGGTRDRRDASVSGEGGGLARRCPRGAEEEPPEQVGNQPEQGGDRVGTDRTDAGVLKRDELPSVRPSSGHQRLD